MDMGLSTGKWTPLLFLLPKDLDIISVYEWKNSPNPIMAMICLQSWPDELSAGLQTVNP